MNISLRRRMRTSGMRSVVGTVGVNATILGIGVATGVLSARLLMPEERGEFLSVVLWSGVISNLALLGLEHSVVYASHGDTDVGLRHSRGLAKRVSLQALVGFVLASVVNLSVIGSTSRHAWEQALIGAAVVPLNAFTQMRLSPLLGGGRIGMWNRIRLSSPLTYLAALVLVAVTGDVTVVKALVAFACGSAMATIWALSNVRLPPLDGESVDTSKLVRYGRATVVMTLAYQLASQADLLIMSAVSDSAVLGVYAVAVSLVSAVDVVRLTADQLLFPKFAAGGWSVRTVRALSVAATTGYLVLAVVIVPIAPVAIGFVYGDAYRSAVEPLAVLLGAAAFRFGGTVISTALRADDEVSQVSRAQALGIAVSVAGVLVLLPIYGGVGAAAAVLLAQVCVFANLFWSIGRHPRRAEREEA